MLNKFTSVAALASIASAYVKCDTNSADNSSVFTMNLSKMRPSTFETVETFGFTMVAGQVIRFAFDGTTGYEWDFTEDADFGNGIFEVCTDYVQFPLKEMVADPLNPDIVVQDDVADGVDGIYYFTVTAGK